jgi:hypothetical protein
MKKSKSTSRVHKRGFASMSGAEVRKIASMGGKASHKLGVAHQFSSAEARKAANRRWKKKK